jgi:arylsulfatase A
MKYTAFKIGKLLFASFALCISFQNCKKINDAEPFEKSSDLNKSIQSTAPNIIIFLGDDIGYEIPTSNGGQSYQTPAIDRMANEGMRFTQCYTAPLCSASRFQLLTGKYNYRNYLHAGIMNPNEKTFATLLKDAGYNTYVAGKWQFDGGDSSIHSLGFNDYLVWNPYVDQVTGSRYKNPVLYENADYRPRQFMKGKYGDDLLTEDVLGFIKSNISSKFFIYYPLCIAHEPFCPTPDDPEFAFWNPHGSISDTSFFPSMVAYTDKKIGQIVDSLKQWGLYNNTIVMFSGDNGTPDPIFSYYKNSLVKGGKGHSTIYGTHVPLMVTWPGHIPGNSVNKNLVDFTDFLPTVASASSTIIPSDYEPIDGVSFYNQLIGVSYTPRDWVFCHFKPNGEENQNVFKRWANNKTYKLYDFTDEFYNTIKDPFEENPLRAPTPLEQTIKNNLRTVLDSHK